MDQPDDSVNLENDPEHPGFRDGNLFIIDLTPAMFQPNQDGQESYFVQCLQTYARILGEKLSWNRRDWMGLVFFGTNQWDKDPEVKYVLTVQKFEEISTKMLSEVLDMSENSGRYREMSAEFPSPLHDVLWHAARAFDSVKATMFRRQVILATCEDRPFCNDEPERHRIRLRAKTFGDLNVNLRVLGLAENWDHNCFYRDIESLANNVESEDVERMLLKDLEVQIRFEARATSHLQFRMGEGLHVRTLISHFSGTTKYLKEVRLCKETNEVLDVFQHYGATQSFVDASDEEEDDFVTAPAPDNTRKGTKYGDELITFSLKELDRVRKPCPAGIDLLGFKKTSLDLKYHVGPPKFVGLDPSTCDEEKELFVALLHKCESKNVMAICSVNERGGPYLAKMLPCIRYGGFYLYRIAFFEQVNDLHDYVETYINGGKEDKAMAADEAGVALMTKVVKRLRVVWNPTMFQNPKLQAQLAYVRTLALDAVAEPVEDITLPDAEMVAERLGDMPTKFTEMFESELDEDCGNGKNSSTANDKNSDKRVKFDDYVFQELIETGRLDGCTVATLRSMARSLGASASGSKAQLIKKITDSYAAKNA